MFNSLQASTLRWQSHALAWLPSAAAAALSLGAAAASLGSDAAYSESLLLIDHDDSIHRLDAAQIALLKTGTRIGAGLAAVGAVLLALLRGRVGTSLGIVVADARRVFAEIATTVELRQRSTRGILVAIGLIGLVVRLAVLDAPMRFDEADTFDYFASRNYFSLLSDYTAPNNHILHTMFVRASYLAFGDSPLALRLPALLAGLAVMPLTFVLGCRLFGQRTALLATALVAVHPGLIRYSAEARGYSAVAALTVVVFLAAASMRERRSAFSWLLLAAAGIAGMFTIPVMLYSLAAASIWALWSARATRRGALAAEIGLAAAMIAAGSTLVYAPAAARSGIDAIVANRYLSALDPALAPAKAALEATAFWRLWTNHVWALAAGLLALAGVAALWGKEGRRLTFATMLGPLLLMGVQQTIPYARVFLFAAPIACLVIAAGIGTIAHAARGGPVNWRGWWALGLAAALGVGHTVGSIWFPTEVERRYLDQDRVADELLKRAGPDIGVYAAIPLSEPIRYKFLTSGRSRGQVTAPDVVTGALPPAEGWDWVLVARTKREPAQEEPSRWIDLDDAAFEGFLEPERILETEFLEVFRMDRAGSVEPAAPGTSR